ncbi:MAG: MFS transporter [Spirochaetales bacterium]|nr:MFS transporter [Spirochaetales bacterium]
MQSLSGNIAKQTMTRGKVVIFAFGGFGWSLLSFAPSNLLTYFYFPPEVGANTFPVFIFQGAVIGVLTILGVIAFTGRIFDAVTDPIIAGISDRSKFKFGRRRTFMLISALPFALLSVIVFLPLTPGESNLNAVWLVVNLFLFYLFFTMYVIPYSAMIPELGHTSKQRLLLCTIGSVGWALGFFIGNSIYALKEVLQNLGLNEVRAMQSGIGLFAIIGFISCMLPVIFIDERKYCEKHSSNEKLFQALKGALVNPDYVFFMGSTFAYFVGNLFLEIGIIYYVTLLMKLPASMASLLMAIMFIASFCFYPLLYKIVDKIGKKRLLSWAFYLQTIVFALISLSGLVPFIPARIMGYIGIALASLAVAVFGIIPGAINSDIARMDSIKTGNHKEGIFSGLYGFMNKAAISFSNLIFPSFLLLGRSEANPLGVRLAAVTGAVMMVIGVLLLRKYNEKRVNSVLATENAD